MKSREIADLLPIAAVAIGLLWTETGCSSGTDYWRNRLDDAADICTFSIGTGFGVKAQVGLLHISPAYNYSEWAALHGGESFLAQCHNATYHVEEGNIGVPFPFVNDEVFYPNEHAARRGKTYSGSTVFLPFLLPRPDGAASKNDCNSCAWMTSRAVQKAAEEKIRQARERGEELENPSHTWEGYLSDEELELINNAPENGGPCELRSYDKKAWYIYSDINVVAAAFGGFSCGVNPGELVDFLIGWAGLDLYNDDL